MKGKKLLVSLLAVVVLLAVTATPVIAATDTEITGNVPKAIEVIAPAGFAMPSLDPALSPIESTTAKTATVNANHAGWQLTVIGSSSGKMMKSTTPLTNAMLVKGGDQTTYTSLASAVTLESSGTVGGSQTISDITFQQAVEWSDTAGDYSITVTFTASAAP